MHVKRPMTQSTEISATIRRQRLLPAQFMHHHRRHRRYRRRHHHHHDHHHYHVWLHVTAESRTNRRPGEGTEGGAETRKNRPIISARKSSGATLIFGYRCSSSANMAATAASCAVVFRQHVQVPRACACVRAGARVHSTRTGKRTGFFDDRQVVI